MTNFYLHICENGHLKTDFKRVRPGDTCSVGGAKMIDSCPECGELIKKWYYYGSVPRGPNQNMGGYQPNGEIPGKNKAIASLVLGIISVVLWFFGYSSILSVVLGIIGVVMASKSKEEGYDENIRTAGFILSVIGIIGGAIFFVACVACVGMAGIAGLAV